MIDRFEYINDKVPHDEPVFILRAKDILAADLVDTWAARAKRRGTPQAKIDEALKIAEAMAAWPGRKVPD